MTDRISDLVATAHHIVVLQADNPDADSLGSALALEEILGGLGKEVTLYCGVDIPTYLRYLEGWDRIVKDLPKTFDLAIVVDANTYTLFEQLQKTSQLAWLKAKPVIVLDHHASVEKPLDFAEVSIQEATASSTGELLFGLAEQASWEVSAVAAQTIMAAILGDTQGLTNAMARADTYRVMARLLDLGADRAKLEELRRQASQMAQVIYRYKGQLLERTQFTASGRIAYVTIPQDEINQYSPLYNPAVLMQFDSLQVTGVLVSIAFKTYDDGHLTAKIRCNGSAPVGARLAEAFGGGGHAYASGFKTAPGQDFESVKAACLEKAEELLTASDEESAQ